MDKGNVIINCYIVIGCIGKFGVIFFFFIGQFNVMGGCEVGGFFNQLVVYMEFNVLDLKWVKYFWKVLNMVIYVGLKVVDLFDVIE